MMLDVDAVKGLDIAEVKADLKKVFVSSQDFWPADFGHYGPLMVRLAWHCAGSFRSSDGRGGCDGARIRWLPAYFDPERSWADNTNLDKARSLLWPIKLKYGKALTWGDLIVLAGTTAIEDMGGPVLGVCLGRIDDADGSASSALGPTPLQEMVAPCEADGDCKDPLGPSTMSLIYVNPEGPLANPVPELSAPQIRDTFARMAMNDAETVALVGGGHAFGKVHGACPTGPGPAPKDQPSDPWPGTCGAGPMKGKGPNTFTSGFEGPWTTNPIAWDNEYFKNLIEYDWEKHKGPGDHWQWRPVPKPGDNDPPAPIMMLTADVALIKDAEYLKWVTLYAENQTALDEAFSQAWYKLMSRDMGPHSRCLGSQLPPSQPFQAPLPPPSKPLPDFAKCAASFRQTDYSGGCNGARIRLAPQKDWPSNKGMDGVLNVLLPIKDKYPTLSVADLIVLAGNAALEDAGARKLKFCGGRSDAPADEAPLPFVPPRQFDDKIIEVRDNWAVKGLSPRDGVALAGRPRSPSQQMRLGYSGSWTSASNKFDNLYFKVLLNEEWDNKTSSAGLDEFRAVGKADVWMTPRDLAIRWDPEFQAIAQEFAADNTAFRNAFAAAWTRFMNADRFNGPTGSECPRK
ncbi:hypothetical protein HYH03_014384 [Edaphochlamys debaryana]|uniref:Plant heme peroxidase family profile domain-containing protein n=1 Tax=Edaphochlamys debaryana TaxID=47281 RepID=A0A836BTN2_9CHLO|nr:hypothetical protein HYH03_014384 [Edaphochlamys debaryana]|eukprot:KAG2487014.1 hypothetical protein HYH03_014384 [Edaphochlamys debaryana]